MPRDIDYYALLGVDREATEAEIRERFRSLAREAHPDRAPAERREEAEAKFQELAQAVNVLTNPERRKVYDFELSMAKAAAERRRDRRRRRRTTSPRESPPTRRRSTRRRRATSRSPSTATRGTRAPIITSAWPPLAPGTCARRSGRSRRRSRSTRRTPGFLPTRAPCSGRRGCCSRPRRRIRRRCGGTRRPRTCAEALEEIRAQRAGKERAL